MVAVTTGESRSAKETPLAVWLTLVTLTVAYVGAMTVLLGIMPWNHAGVTESPFVTTFRMVKIPQASGVMNFVVLTAALSGANATIYVASRMIFSLARTGWAPAKLGILNREGSPQYAVAVSSIGVVIALVFLTWAPRNAFRYILGAAFTGMILSWIVSLGAHISFRRHSSRAQLSALTLRSPLGIFGSVIGLAMVILALVQTWLMPRVNFWSGISLVSILTMAFFLRRPR